MDFWDVLGLSAAEGSRTTRIITGIVGAILGAAIGYFTAPILGDGGIAPVTGGVLGAVVGGGFGALFSGLVLFGLIVVACIGVAILWSAWTG